MFDIGFWELLLIAVVALVVVGPDRLPRLARITGLWLGRASAQLQSIKNEISAELRAEELKQALRKPEDMPDLNEKIDLDQPAKKESKRTNNDSAEDNDAKR
ncbi:Sec-independent protein translocase protein TatB [Methylophaga sp. OBS3]|uniref:Sec-independent protein translocase protein TatB n=1 Tax=Methylophaga sp. OBS3 TaxID=2991934 RepID=UPI00225A46A9|nr:Sec-independent protein translocase protein TatB [Methylophaga sp. OBS3]MCX4189755.1 Sec-independent protein translocase protein TatB [Methylophaga sp. OBS3]